MRRACRYLALLWSAGVTWAQTGTVAYPKSLDYPVTDLYSGKTAKLQYETAEHEKYRGELRIAEIRMPTFAGHYIVVEMFCGVNCERLAVVDAQTGKIHGSPFRSADSEFALPPPSWDFRQPEYNVYSRLMTVPNVCPRGPGSCATFFFLWENDKFRLIARKPVSAVPVIPDRSPFIGIWEGSWGYTNGFEDIIHAFRLEIRETRDSRLVGSYVHKSLGPKAKRQSIRRITQAKADKSAYRMEIGGNCWNARLRMDRTLAGCWNGEPCNAATGLGGGARLIAFEAKRVSSPAGPNQRR